MHRWSNQRNGALRLLMAGLMAGLMFVLTVISWSGGLHQAFHGKSDNHHGQCAVCALQQGKLDAPPSARPTIVASFTLAWTLPPAVTHLVRHFDYSLPPGRGPPASVSSL